ncbi:MAG TPA: hypothetical protein VN725_02905 [Rhodanobacteraceae bacterium]|nr:hypothetical protein [Rhodanobacteraceae bacterium]
MEVTKAKTLDYKIHPWTSPFGLTFGRSNSFQTNLPGFLPGRRA